MWGGGGGLCNERYEVTLTMVLLGNNISVEELGYLRESVNEMLIQWCPHRAILNPV